MPILEWIEKLGRTIFESPFGGTGVAGEAPELAEIRLALLEEAKARSHRVAGRPVFPYNVARVLLRGIPEERSEIFRSGFFRQFCEQELRAGLAKSGCRFPDDLCVEVETTPALPASREGWLSLSVEGRSAARAGVRRSARLVVVKGDANEAEIILNKARANIGRTLEIYRAGGPSRRNDLAFREGREINRTVSREHAHILFTKKTGEYRLFNDRHYNPGSDPESACGLWIIREGMSRAVPHDTRGVRLQPGDEIHFGRAVARFVVR